ncbi:FAD-dependent oxidoreductase [Xanthobacter autotrophicus]|uniref:FAD-dependent oxidoreductase n=1 Tax=Xanthobacter autotrophicus TaxID=280 RepID=UPI00372BA455
MTGSLPIAIIGAGPVGLAAAAHLLARGLTPLVFERGAGVGTSLKAWGHVRVFSPWGYNIDEAARTLLEASGWSAPNSKALPLGGEIVRRYLEPLAAHPALAPHLRFGAQVSAIVRHGLDKMSSEGRADTPFEIRWRDAAGHEHRSLARAVIDASGTWTQPNPMGADGLPVPGEERAAAHIAYGIPDVSGTERETYSGRRVLVVGSGHSAINVVLDLLRLQETAPATLVTWALRRNRMEKLLGGGLNDALPARGALGLAATQAIAAGRLDVLAPFAVERIGGGAAGLDVSGHLGPEPWTGTVDRIVVATGFRPDLAVLREVRVALDPAVEAPHALAPLIDPNLHSCGTVPPHGAVELAHPEPGFYIVGSKSYGRAPTFLMATGYEQVRSIAAEIAGDHEAARSVHLVLPETGVCSAAPVTTGASGCCGGPAPRDADACCADDAQAKAEGEDGCGCDTAPTQAEAPSCCSTAP